MPQCPNACKRCHACDDEIEQLQAALQEIAEQNLPSEMDEDQIEHSDWAGGYEECVKHARKALNGD